jgi:PAS domain-containing protein
MSWPADTELLQQVLDAIPSPLFVVDDDVRIRAFNAAASPLMGEAPTLVFNQRGGEALHCIHSTEAIGGCGASVACKTCVIRNAVGETCASGSVVRRTQRMQLVGPSGARDVYVLVTTSPLRHSDGPRALLIFQNMSDLLTAQGFVPVCMHCRKVREEGKEWTPMETYLKTHLDVDITHGLCPDCFQKHYPEYGEERGGGD